VKDGAESRRQSRLVGRAAREKAKMDNGTGPTGHQSPAEITAQANFFLDSMRGPRDRPVSRSPLHPAADEKYL